MACSRLLFKVANRSSLLLNGRTIPPFRNFLGPLLLNCLVPVVHLRNHLQQLRLLPIQRNNSINIVKKINYWLILPFPGLVLLWLLWICCCDRQLDSVCQLADVLAPFLGVVLALRHPLHSRYIPVRPDVPHKMQLKWLDLILHWKKRVEIFN